MIDFNNYYIKVVKNKKEFTLLEKDWNKLSRLQKGYQPFLNHDWFKLWFKLFLFNNEIHILLVFDRENLLVIAPFIIIKKNNFIFSYKKIELIGNAYTPRRDFIIGEISEEEKYVCIGKIIQYFFETKRNWDIINLSPLIDNENYLNLLKAIKNNNLKYKNAIIDTNWYIDKINFSGEDYLKNRSKKIKSEMMRREKKLSKKGEIEFKVVREYENINEHINKYYDVYSRSWKEKEGINPNFHREYAKLAAKNGWLRLGFLSVDGYPIASQFRIVYNDTCVFLKTVYDKGYRKYGPGLILLSKMIKYLIDGDRVKFIDFGPGNEEYKSSWATKKRNMQEIIVYNSNLRGRIYAFINLQIIPLVNNNKKLKKLKNTIKSILIR